MSRETRPSVEQMNRPRVGIDLKVTGDVGIVSVLGLVDENFQGFGSIGSGIKSLVIEVSGMTRMTSFGVRQWLKAMDALPKTVGDVYLLGCPTFFVDQLNMVLNFGGTSKVLSVVAPYTCPSCGVESGESIDVLAERATLAMGGVPEKECARCGAKLEFDETPESYFSFVTKHAATAIQPGTAEVLAAAGLYITSDVASEKPPRIIKLVHGPVTYLRIIGTIGAMFRARPLLVGAEGEVVIDLAEVDRFDTLGSREWRRLLKNLISQVRSVTLVDVSDAFLAIASDSFTLAKSIAVWSILVPYRCGECGRVTSVSHVLNEGRWPITFPEQVCATCGGVTACPIDPLALAPLQHAVTSVPRDSLKLIEQRQEVLSRALTDANVASADAAAPSLSPDDTILGKYKIIRRLSTSGVAEVFLAKQIGIGGFEKPVTLKRILPEWLESQHFAVDMFLNEAKIAGRLIHPNIVQVLDVGQVGGALYLAMEYVHGKDLREVLRKLHASSRSMRLGDACYIITQVAQALHHAYWATDLNGKQLAVIHRDVSPHKVMLGYDGSVKLLDFGAAMSAVTDNVDSKLAGKWSYMSPEHTASASELDHRSDLFSLGVMLYLLMTGSLPFAGSDPREIVKKIRAGAFKPVKQAAPDLPNTVAEMITRMLAASPDERPRTGMEVVTALTDFTRSYGIESSASRIANLLTETFGSAELEESRAPAQGQPPRPPPAREGARRVTLRQPQAVPAESVAAMRKSGRDVAHPEDANKPPQLRPRLSSVLWVFVLLGVIAAVMFGVYLVVRPK